MNTSQLDELAKRQLADYDAHHPGRISEQGASVLTVAQAYGLQVAVVQLRMQRGESLAGYKLVGQDIPDSEWLRQHQERAIATAFAVIELHNYVFRSNVRTVQELIANNALHQPFCWHTLPRRTPRLGSYSAPRIRSSATTTSPSRPGGASPSLVRRLRQPTVTLVPILRCTPSRSRPGLNPTSAPTRPC
jgi:hypothetical protein